MFSWWTLPGRLVFGFYTLVKFSWKWKEKENVRSQNQELALFVTRTPQLLAAQCVQVHILGWLPSHRARRDIAHRLPKNHYNKFVRLHSFGNWVGWLCSFKCSLFSYYLSSFSLNYQLLSYYFMEKANRNSEKEMVLKLSWSSSHLTTVASKINFSTQ